MKHKHPFILLTILIILTSTLACGLFGGGDETADSSTNTDQSVERIEPDQPEGQESSEEQQSEISPEEKSDSVPPPEFDLGDEYRSEEGGYGFKPIPDYKIEEIFGLSTMIAPDADPDLGPMLMLIGGINEEEQTGDDIFNDFIEDAESEDVEILDRKEISVDGKPGLLANIAGVVDGEQVIGRIVVVAVAPTQQFTMFASAPKDRWEEIESSFGAVLASVHFFEPQEIDITEELEEAEPDDDVSDEAPVLDIPALEEFPTEANQLPSGGFAYLIASEQGFPTIVSDGTLQDQSTGTEYVIDLVSEDQENILTLYIPLDVAPGIYPMDHFDETSPEKAPGAAVDMSLTRYTNTDGIIMIDAVVDSTITGSVFFTAVDENGNEIGISGFFNELPIAQQ